MDIVEFIETVRSNKYQNCLVHFTDKCNIPSIKRHGLLSTKSLKELGIEARTGGNDWSLDADKRFGMDEYVHLSFREGHPMGYLASKAGQIKDLVNLEIEPDVLRSAGVLVTSGVSNKSGMAHIPIAEGLGNLEHLKMIYEWTDWKDPGIKARLKIVRKYEILIPKHVPTSLIRGI